MHMNTSSTSLAVPSLHPYYEYEYTVAAYTVRVGPYSSVNRVQLPEDGEFSVHVHETDVAIESLRSRVGT